MTKIYPPMAALGLLVLAACGDDSSCPASRALNDHERVLYERAETVMEISAPEPTLAYLPSFPCGDGWCLEKYPKAGGAYSRKCEAIFAPDSPASREHQDWIIFIEAGHHLLHEVGVPKHEQHCHELYVRLDGGHSCAVLGEDQAL